MGKRNVVVVVSSSDDEEDRVRVSCSSTSSNSKQITGRRVAPNRSKRARRVSKPPHKQSYGSAEVSFDALLEDFSDDVQGFRKVTGSGWSEKRELWVDKYKPQSLEDLAVHKKKVEEVKMWLKERLKASKDEFHSHTLVITGQAGVGKSATIHVTASYLGATVCEWDTPTPTLWKEYVHNSSSGTHYTSKLDEFENFVERIRKYALLPFSSTSGSMKSILLIDDLPLTNRKVDHSRLCNCLHILARSAQIPTVILITEYTKADSTDNAIRLQDLQSAVESAGGFKVAFNPITTNSIKRTLSRICREEQCKVTAEQMDQIAKASGGDIRHAIASLQYFSLRSGQTLSLSVPVHSKYMSDELKSSDDGVGFSFGRDETLSLFHALGKFLHNKRETEHSTDIGKDVFLLSEQFARLPLKMEAPEKILSQSHGQARNVADFLHENVIDFLGEEAMDDAWAVASYLSDADNLLAPCLRGYGMIGTYALESVTESAAASVAVRGVLFGNSHPGPSRWHAIRTPKIWQVERSSRTNKNTMVREREEVCHSLSVCDKSVMATEYKPLLKWLHQGRMRDQHMVNLDSDKPQMDHHEQGMILDQSGQSDDEIEDW